MLSADSKMFEVQIRRPIDSHIAKHKLHDRQWGYAEGRSTETLQGEDSWDTRDVREAFDSVEHHILLENVQAIEISGGIYELVGN